MSGEVMVADLAWPEVPACLAVRVHDRPVCTGIVDVVCRAVSFLSPDETLVADFEAAALPPGSDVCILALPPIGIPRATKLRIVLRAPIALAEEANEMRVSVRLESGIARFW